MADGWKEQTGRWRVWQWGVEAGLGSHGQRKLSSRFIKTGFDSKAEAQAWADAQPQEEKDKWGFWDVDCVGGNCVVECRYCDIPTSFKAALLLAVPERE